MQERYNVIYIAPHLDDVALSCGGQIAQRTHRGEKVLIVTITAGDPPTGNLPPFAQAHHVSWQLDAETVVADRRAEDARSAQILGADYCHFDLLDAIYRREGKDGSAHYNNDLQLFGDIAPVESVLVDQLVEKLLGLPSADLIIAPLAIGGHVDHRMTRFAAESAFATLVYYEDYPYVQWNGLGDSVTTGWMSELIPISEDALTTKIAAIAAYKSQIDHLFEDYDDMLVQVTTYAHQIGGERLWKKSSV